MIKYRNDGIHFLTKLFQLKGSVIPRTLRVSIPCGVVAGIMKWLANIESVPDIPFMENNVIWNGFSVLVGFLIVFRTSQSYSRFWEGCGACAQMRAIWFDCCSALIAFSKTSKSSDPEIRHFQQKVIRLFSMLHAAALAELEDVDGKELDEIEAFKFELLDAEGLDEQSLVALMAEDQKVELVYAWIQNLMTHSISSILSSTPPPILSRAFQQLGGGMVAFHSGLKVAKTPFPFPYAQMCDGILILHLCLVPFVVYPWVLEPWAAGVFSFIQVFVLWALNFIAVEIENPFGIDDNDLDVRLMQRQMNDSLKLLVRPHASRQPELRKAAVNFATWEDEQFEQAAKKCGLGGGNYAKSYSEIWAAIDSKKPVLQQNKKELLMKTQAARSGSTLSTLRSSVLSAGSSRPCGISTRSVVTKSTFFAGLPQPENSANIARDPLSLVAPGGDIAAAQLQREAYAMQPGYTGEWAEVSPRMAETATAPAAVPAARRGTPSGSSAVGHIGSYGQHGLFLPPTLDHRGSSEALVRNVKTSTLDPCLEGRDSGTSKGSSSGDLPASSVPVAGPATLGRAGHMQMGSVRVQGFEDSGPPPGSAGLSGDGMSGDGGLDWQAAFHEEAAPRPMPAPAAGPGC